MLPKHLHKYFWDVDAKKIDIKKDARYIVYRLLEYGDIQDLKWMFRSFPEKLIKEVLETRRGFSPKAVNFWRIFFNIPENKILCLKKSSQKTQKILWPY